MIISGSFKKLTRQEAEVVSKALDGSWKDSSIPETQYKVAVKNELERYYKGAPCAAFTAFVQCLLQIPSELDKPETQLLEVGASSGYYYEVMKIAGFRMTYNGSDYSEHFKKLAGLLYPEMKFTVCDARNLPWPEDYFDVVVSGCVMIHVLDYPKIIQETARVTKKYAIFHRTPISLNHETEYFQKLAYDIPCLEIHFREEELMDEFTKAGFRALFRYQIFSDENSKLAHYSYLLEKV